MQYGISRACVQQCPEGGHDQPHVSSGVWGSRGWVSCQGAQRNQGGQCRVPDMVSSEQQQRRFCKPCQCVLCVEGAWAWHRGLGAGDRCGQHGPVRDRNRLCRAALIVCQPQAFDRRADGTGGQLRAWRHQHWLWEGAQWRWHSLCTVFARALGGDQKARRGSLGGQLCPVGVHGTLQPQGTGHHCRLHYYYGLWWALCGRRGGRIQRVDYVCRGWYRQHQTGGARGENHQCHSVLYKGVGVWAEWAQGGNAHDECPSGLDC